MIVNPHTKWPHNARVTLRANASATGRTVAFTAKSNRQRYVRIQMDDPQFKRAEGLADARVFILGAGPKVARCIECRETYRHDGSETSYDDGFCPACGTQRRPNAAPGSETRKVQATLFGTATHGPRLSPVATPDPADKVPTPFDVD